MTSKSHRHTAATSKIRAYTGPVGRRQNRAAHGNTCCIETCGCGAERRTNVNGYHTESSGWIVPEAAPAIETGVHYSTGETCVVHASCSGAEDDCRTERGTRPAVE